MNLEFKETIPQADKEEDIILNGNMIGKVTTHADSERYTHRCHAAINIRGGGIGLIQGWGDTKEASIENAVTVGREDLERGLRSISELEKQLGV